MKIIFVPKINITPEHVLSRNVSFFLLFFSSLIVIGVPILLNLHIGGDQSTLQRLIEDQDVCNPAQIFSGQTSSYGCSAAALNIIGANIHNAWIYGSIANIILFFLPFIFFSRISIWAVMLAVACALIRGFFLFVLDKELLVSVVVIISLIFVYKKQSLTGWIISALLYGTFFRIYWILALVIWFIFSRMRKITYINFIFYILSGYLSMAIMMSVILDKSIGSYREASNLGREASADLAKTMIKGLVQSNNAILQAIDTFIMFFRLSFPIESVFLSPSINTIGVALVTPICVSICFYLGTQRCVDLGRKNSRNIALIPLSLLIIEGVFEPDYGSFTRHFFMITPFIFAAVGINKSLKQRNRERNVVESHKLS